MSETKLTPPEGYEIVDRDTERGEGICIGKDWLYLDWVDCRKWVLTRHAGTALFQMPADTIYARPIRKPSCGGSTSTCGPECWQSDVGATMDSLAAEAIASETDRRILADLPASPWVRASERQPPVDEFVLVRSTVGEPYAYRHRRGGLGLFGGEQWLDVNAVDRLAGENAKLLEDLEEEKRRHAAWFGSAHNAHRALAECEQEVDRLREELIDELIRGARIAELEKELDRRRDSDIENIRLRSELSRARDTEIGLLRTVAQLRQEKERCPVELTFGELVRMAVRDQSFDPEA